MTDTRGIDEQVNTAIRGMEGKMTVEAGEAGEDKEEIRPIIAAAPDMLEALVGAKWLIECCVAKPEGYEEYQDVVKAIRKARGEE